MAIRRPRLRPELTIFGFLGMLASAQATETLIYGADVGVGESDNVTLASSGKVSQTLAIADVDFALKDQTRLFDAEAKGYFSELDYLQGAYASELIGRFDGTARYSFIPEKLSWTLQDDFGQSALDPFAPVTPLNRENVNYAGMGPNLDLRLGGVGFLSASLRYARVDYQTSPFDSDRFSGNLGCGRLLSAGSSISLNLASERVLFDDTQLNTDYTRSSLYGAYELEGVRTKLDADLGVTRVDLNSSTTGILVQNVPTGQIAERGLAPSTQTGELLNVHLERLLSSVSKLTLSAGRNLTDGSTSFSTLQPGALATIGTAPAALTSGNYTATYGSIGWLYLHHRTSIAMSGQWEKDAYQGLPQLDSDRENAQLNATRLLTGALSAQLIGSLSRTGYSSTPYTETDRLVGAALILRQGRWLEIKLRIDHAARSASGLGAQPYTENRAFLMVGYRPRVNSGGTLPGSVSLGKSFGSSMQSMPSMQTMP